MDNQSEDNQVQDEQSELDDMMMRLVKRKVEAFNPFRRAQLLETTANIAYLCGIQNIGIRGGTIVPLPQTGKYFVPVIANKLLPAVTNDIAVSTKAKPTFDIIPAGTDEDDEATAKICEKILPYLQRINDPHLHRKAVVLWYDIAGIGWRKTYWNPNYKVMGRNPLPDEEGHNPDLPPMAPVFQGEVIVEHIPNNEFIYDWRIKNPRRLKWGIHHKSITVGEVRERFGDEIAAQIPQGVQREKDQGKNSFEIKIANKFAGLSQQLVSTPPDPEEGKLIENDKFVDYYEFWHVIDKNMPQGAYAVGLGDLDKLVAAVNQPYPEEQYPHKELPFVGASPLPLSGVTMSSIPRLSQARPLQREYNDIRSKISDNIDAMGNCVLIAARGANIDFKKVDNLAANIIEVDGPYVSGIRREPGVPISAGVFLHLETIRKDIDEIFAFHEPSKGIMPAGGPRSAIGLQTLQEADATQLSPMIVGMDESDERVVYQMLSLALANYDDRLIEVVGKDNRWTLEQINANELNGKINVIVRTGSSLPLNKTLEQEKTIFAWQSGLLGNPNDPDVRVKVLKAMDLGAFDQILQDNDKHENLAKREFIEAEKLALQMPPIPEGASTVQIQQLLGQYVFVPPVNSFDDHFVHQRQHTNFILDKYYEYIGSGQVHLQILARAIIDHNNEHSQAIMQQQLMQVQMQMMIRGTTPEQIELKKKPKQETKKE